jgi:hypothetical protein
VIVALATLVLDPPTNTIIPEELYLATTAELSRRFARIYTTLGTEDPLYRGASASIANGTSGESHIG